ncbi:hypothetical protein HS125_19435 [bacterium]|nr:hypothetical protein [bacterium]
MIRRWYPANMLLTQILVALMACTMAVAAPLRFVEYPGNPVLLRGPDGTPDDTAAGRPCVIRVGNELRMYYMAHGGTLASIQIRHATSEDGITWNKVAGPPLLAGDGSGFDALYVTDPTVVVDNGQYHMWFVGADVNANMTFGHVYSTDGIQWTTREQVLNRGVPGAFDNFTMNDPCVIKVGGVFHMWYDGRNGPTSIGNPTNFLRVGYATSTNGINWQKRGVVLSPGTPGSFDEWSVYGPEVRYDAGLFEMYYTAQNYAAVTQIGVAVSLDGENWTKVGMALTHGAAGTWNAFASNFPSVLDTPGGLMMWFSGDAVGQGRTDIGLAQLDGRLVHPGSVDPQWFALPLVALPQNSGTHGALMDLDDFVTDNSTMADSLTFTVVRQSNPEIVQVSTTARGAVSATVQPDRMGLSGVVFRVQNPFGRTADARMTIAVGSTGVPMVQWESLK